ncbi:MAG: single-stranded DNA-binding protein [Spirochaetales bacterium]|nr:single-stranded DNA-binding protein [Candidatus Physcosoma equi]
MADINSVTLTGRLTRDAELKYAPNGNAIVRFSMAVNRSKRNSDGSWVDEPSFFDCVYFGKPAEAVNSYLSKGRQIAVQGELRQSRWEQEGQSRSRVEVYINNLSLGSGSQGGTGRSDNGAFPPTDNGSQNGGYQRGGYNGGYQGSNSYSKPQGGYQAQPVSGPEDFQDDNIPF